MRPLPSLIVLFACSSAVPAPGDSPLSFTQLSAGLQVPGMEVGRTEIEFADINRNGSIDMLSIGDHGSPFVNSGQSGIMVWFGDGAGNWSHEQTGYFGYGGIAIGDVNNNGIWDVGYGMHHDWSSSGLGVKLLEVALGDGTGTNWTPWYDGLATAGETWGMFSTDFADVNNNGWLDIGSISFGCCAGLHVYTNNADGSWTHAFGFTGGNSAMEFHFGDFNGDGHADFAASHGSGTVYLGDGTGNFTLADANLPGSSWRTGLSIGDVTGNGRDDIAWTSGNSIQVWTLAPGGEETGQWQDLTANLADVGQAFHRTQIADMTLNGRGEVLAARPGMVVIYSLNDGGTWDLLAEISLPSGCSQAAALRAGTDATHNGYPDFVVVTRENCGLFGTGGKNQVRFFANAHQPLEPAIHPVFPRGGHTFIAGQVRFIRWHAAIPSEQRGDGDLPAVTLELSLNGAEGPWQTIATDLPPSGRYQWHVPATLPSTDNAFMRFTLAGDPPATAISPQPFAIIGGKTVPGDLTGDGTVGVDDLLMLLAAWGPCADCAACPADLTGDCAVGVDDLLILLANWT